MDDHLTCPEHALKTQTLIHLVAYLRLIVDFSSCLLTLRKQSQ